MTFFLVLLIVLCAAAAYVWTLWKLPSFSVVIPTIGRKEGLARIIKVLLPVLPARSEILIVDDRQPHHEQGPLLPTSLQDSRIRILQGPRKGFACGPRNVGIREARGDWILFCDDDDVLHPKIFQWMSEMISFVPKVDVIVWRAQGEFDHVAPNYPIPPAESTTVKLGLVTNSFAVRRVVAPFYSEQVDPKWKRSHANGGIKIHTDEDFQYLQTCKERNLQIAFSHRLAYGFGVPPPYHSPSFPIVLLPNQA